MRGFRVWSDFWKKYATEAELYMDGSVDAIFEGTDGVPHHENADLVVEFKTGLKDKKGKEIYGGDIVKWDYAHDYEKFAVYWKQYDAGFWLYRAEGFDPKMYAGDDVIGGCSSISDDYEVIGNIHENPELLEEEE